MAIYIRLYAQYAYSFFFLSRSLFILNNARNHLHWFCQMVNLVLYHGCGIELITIAYLSLFNYLSEKDKNKNNSYDFTVSVCECANISGFFTNQPTNQPFSIGYRIFYVGKKKYVIKVQQFQVR